MDERSSTTMQECVNCGGLFPGPGVSRGRKIFCCDMCVHQFEVHAPGMLRRGLKLLGIAGLAAGIFMLGQYSGRA